MMQKIFELTLKLSGFDISGARKKLFDLKMLTNEEKLKRRDDIVKFHINNNRFYRELLQGREDLLFEQLPVIKKSTLQKGLKSVISERYKLADLFVSNTSGSSGHPFFFAKDKDSHALTHALVLDLYSQHGISANQKQARFYGIPSSGMSKYKELLKDILSNRVRFPVFDLSDERLELYLSRFYKHKFGYIYGYTSAIVLFANFLIRKKIILKEVCSSIKCCIVTSEVCTLEDRRLIEKAVGVTVVNEYGCSETGIIAFEDQNGVWKLATEDAYYEVVDDNDNPVPFGQEGRILITSLSNKAMPFIRYEVGDLGIIESTTDGLILMKLTGRVSDIIKLPSGKIAAGLTFYYISRSILESNDFIREFIVRQTSSDTFQFDMVTDRDLTNQEIVFLKKQMDNYLEPGLKLVINRVDEIQRPASGKIKHFYSEIN